MKSPLLEVSHLTKTYQRKNGLLVALKNMTFLVDDGEFLCLVGPSGCGKTTLLRILAGLLVPDEGQVFLKGQSLQGPRRETALIFQKNTLMPWRTVFDNILLPLQVQRMSPSPAKEKVNQILTWVGLQNFSTSYPHELSGGMQQRVALARTLVAEPDLLLLDEPFGALDAMSRENLNQELLRLWKLNAQTVVMVTHDIQEAVFLADRILVLSQRPATIAAEISIPLSRPRTTDLFYDPQFNTLAYQVRQAIQ